MVTICDHKQLEIIICDIKLAFSTKTYHYTDLIHTFAYSMERQ